MSQDPWQTPDSGNPWQQPGQQPPPPPTQAGGYPGGYPAAPPPPPAYPQYPGGAYGAYGAPMATKPPMPNSVKTAVNLMFAGMGLALLNIVVGLALLSKIEDNLRADGYLTTTIDSDKSVFVGSTVVGGLIGAGLWLWMALATRSGHNYARIVSSVFFGIGVLGSLVNLGAGYVPALAKLMSVAVLVIGLLAIVFVWKKESGPYFNPPPPGYPYGYGGPQPPYGQGQPPYGGGQPPYGQG